MSKKSQVFFKMCIFVGVVLLMVQFKYTTKTTSESQRLTTKAWKNVTVGPYFTVDGDDWLDRWTSASRNVYVFSAYLDSRLGPNNTVIRIIGLIRIKPALKVTCSCLVNDHPGKPSYPVKAKVEILQDNHRTPYAGAYFLCPYSSEPSTTPPESVRLAVSDAELGISPRIPVRNRITAEDATNDAPNMLALCVRPFHDGVPELHDLVHFVAYYAIQGVQRFTFYSYYSNPKVQAYLKRLSGKLQMDFISWNLPVGKRSWALAQNAFTQDCLYRHMTATRYVLIVDMDEFVFTFPKRGRRTRLVDLVTSLPESKSCFLFRNVFWIREASTPERPFIFQGRNRSRRVWPAMNRSKYVARVDDVIEGGIHFCRRFLGTSNRSGHRVVKDALLFHYKKPRTETYMYDKRMQVWKDTFFTSSVISDYFSWMSAQVPRSPTPTNKTRHVPG